MNVFAGVLALAGWDAITGASDSAARAQEPIPEDAVALRRSGREPDPHGKFAALGYCATELIADPAIRGFKISWQLP